MHITAETRVVAMRERAVLAVERPFVAVTTSREVDDDVRSVVGQLAREEQRTDVRPDLRRKYNRTDTAHGEPLLKLNRYTNIGVFIQVIQATIEQKLIFKQRFSLIFWRPCLVCTVLNLFV